MTKVMCLFGLLLLGCMDPLPLRNIPGKPMLVVDGMITDQPGPYRVALSWTSAATGEEEEPKVVTGAQVWISDDKGLSLKLSESQPGIYLTDSAAILGTIGNIYTLRILHDELEYLSFEEPLMPAGEVDSVYSEFRENSINQTDPTQPQDALTFFVDGHADPEYPQGLTRWRSTGIYEVLTYPELKITMQNEVPVPDPLGCSGFVNADNKLQFVHTCLCCYCWVYEYSREATVSPNRFVPGRYSIVAYSDGMKTSDPSLFFQCPLRVSGPWEIADNRGASDFHFFPEGGHFVSGITNKVIIKGPPHSSGAIISEDGSTVASFKSEANGLGLFYMTPRMGMSYFAYLPAENRRLKLPEAEPDGAGLLASVPANKSPIRVTMLVPPNSALKQSTLLLALSSHSRIYYAAELAFGQRDFVALSIPQDNLPAGIARLTIFDAEQKEVADRLLFLDDPFAPQVRLNLPAKRFSTREEIPLTVNISRDKRPLTSSFAITVYHEHLLHHTVKNIYDNAFLYGDLSESLNGETIVYNGDDNSRLSLDHFLITRKWIRFKWEDVWSEKLAGSDFEEHLHFGAGRFFRRARRFLTPRL